MAAVPSIGRAAGVAPQPSDAGATQELYERYSGRIHRFCVNRLGSHDEAEDATQSTFLNAHRALRRGVTPEAELAWLFKIAHNVCLTRRRTSRRRSRVESPSDLGAVQDVLPAPQRESADELIRLTDALSHMPDNQRRAILLREWQGLSYHEIAADLDLTQSAVETLIFRARRALAANLEVEPRQPRLLARVRKAFDVGTLLAGFKTLFATSAAVKATAAAVAVSGTAVVATNFDEPVARPIAERPAVVAKAPATPAQAVDPRPAAQLDRTVPARTETEIAKRVAVVPPKAQSGMSTAARAQAPGLVRKTSVAPKPKQAAKPKRQPPAVSKANAAPRSNAAKPVKKPKPVQAGGPPAQPPAASVPNGNGNGKSNGAGRGKPGG